MRCPFCAHDDSQVKDSRPTEDNTAIRRRRQCDSCGGRFTTFGRVQLRGAIVVNDVASLQRSINALNDAYYYQQVTEITVRFVEEHQGATEKIMRYIQEKRFLTRE